MPAATTKGLFLCVLIVLTGGVTIRLASAQEVPFVRFSKPQALNFDELVQLEKTDEPRGQLTTRLDELLDSPFIGNEAAYERAKPHRTFFQCFGILPSCNHVEH